MTFDPKIKNKLTSASTGQQAFQEWTNLVAMNELFQKGTSPIVSS